MESPVIKEDNLPRFEIKLSFFTRKFSKKMEQRGSKVPSSVISFLDTPLCTFDEKQRIYFDEKFCPHIPSIISVLMEIFEEMGADREGWADTITYSSSTDTPIKICARAVLVRKEKEAQDSSSLSIGREQRTKKIQLPNQFQQVNPTMC